MTDWVQVEKLITQLGFSLTFTSQLTLLFLTLFCIQREFGAYKHLVISFCLVAIIFTSLELVLYPLIHSYNSGYIFFTLSNPFGVSNEVVKVLLASYTGLYSSTIALLTVQFIYRYVAVFQEEKVVYFEKFYFFIWLVYSFWFGFQWGACFYVFGQTDSYSVEYMQEVMNVTYAVDINKLPILTIIAFNEDNSVRWWDLMCTFNVSFIMFIQYGIMMFCGHGLYFHMNEKLSSYSPALRRLHKQIFKTLTIQITTPTIFLFSPVIFTIYAPLFNLKLSLPTGTFVCGSAFYPALDAVIMMCIITDYRKSFEGMLVDEMERIIADSTVFTGLIRKVVGMERVHPTVTATIL